MSINLKHSFIFWIIVGFSSSFNCLAISNIHEFNSQPSQESCLACHNSTPDKKASKNTQFIVPDLSNFKRDGIAMCTDCHSEESGHVVGDKIEFPVPADLPLGEGDTISCLTCHFTHGSLKSDRPQASVSFMDKLLGSERLHKSFLIRRNNVDGELCLTCHKATEE